MTDDVNDEDKSRLISLPEAAEMYGFNAKYLAQLANKGRLDAQKIGGIWLTTPNQIEIYIRSRKKTGVFRHDIEIND